MLLACLWASRVRTWPSAPASAATRSANGKPATMPSLGAMYSHLCRVVDILESEGARFSGDAHARHEQESRSAKVLRWCAARLLLSTLTDEFAFRRILRIDLIAA